MIVSTRGRYALRVMIDIAEHPNETYIPLKSIAARQGISEKYLESIVSMLVKNDFLAALRGKGGGYKLIRRPEEYTVGSILKITEGSFAPVACLEHSPNQCARVAYCKTLPMWEGFQKLAENYFNGITIQDLVNQNNDVDDYVI